MQLFLKWVIHLFNNKKNKAYYVPHTSLGAGDTSVNEAGRTPCIRIAYILMGEIDNKHKKLI